MEFQELEIVKAEEKDLDKILEVFTISIQNLCDSDYTENQINAWISGANNNEKWLGIIKREDFILAKFKNQVVGFASLQSPNYLNLLYIKPDFIKMGIARLLYEYLERKVKSRNFKVHASKTALLFFKKMGFTVIKKNKVVINEIEILNYYMEKPLKIN